MKITTTVPGSVKCAFTEVECERPVLNVPIRLVLGQAADWESYDVHFELSDDDEILDVDKDEKDNDGKVEIQIEDHMDFIDDDEISKDNDITVEVVDDNKD